MFVKKIPVSLFLCMVLLATACTGKSTQSSNGTDQNSGGGKSGKVESLKNTYWVSSEEDDDFERTVELIFKDDGSFHCRSITPNGIYEPFYMHVEADSYTWIQNSDTVELEFSREKPHKKEIFYAQILDKGNKMTCPDMFELSDEELTFVKQDGLPKFTSIEEDSEKLVGEWELISVGGDSPSRIITDEDTPFESSINIYMKDEKMYADYHIVRWKDFGKNDIKQIGISFDNEPITPSSTNEFWCAAFDEPIIPEGLTLSLIHI